MTTIIQKNLKLRIPTSDGQPNVYLRPQIRTAKRVWPKYLLYGSLFFGITYFYFSGKNEDPIEKKINEIKYMKPRFADSVPILDRLTGIGLLKGSTDAGADINKFQSFVFQEHNHEINRAWGKYWAANKFESYCTNLAYTANPDGNFDKGIIPECIHELARTTFTDSSDEIFNLYSKMHLYNLWMQQNTSSDEWKQMTFAEREKALWEKRYKLLGGEATEDIFKRRLDVYKSAGIMDTVNRDNSLPLEEKIKAYRNQIKNEFGDTGSKSFMKDEKNQVANNFLNSENVQKELASMQPEERSSTLQKMRQSLGFSADEIQQLAQLDSEKEALWEKQIQYQKIYNQYSSLYKDAELNSRLRETRERLFGTDEAVIIENEEKRGVFRYKEKRKYGL